MPRPVLLANRFSVTFTENVLTKHSPGARFDSTVFIETVATWANLTQKGPPFSTNSLLLTVRLVICSKSAGV